MCVIDSISNSNLNLHRNFHCKTIASTWRTIGKRDSMANNIEDWMTCFETYIEGIYEYRIPLLCEVCYMLIIRPWRWQRRFLSKSSLPSMSKISGQSPLSHLDSSDLASFLRSCYMRCETVRAHRFDRNPLDQEKLWGLVTWTLVNIETHYWPRLSNTVVTLLEDCYKGRSIWGTLMRAKYYYIQSWLAAAVLSL